MEFLEPSSEDLGALLGLAEEEARLVELGEEVFGGGSLVSQALPGGEGAQGEVLCGVEEGALAAAGVLAPPGRSEDGAQGEIIAGFGRVISSKDTGGRVGRGGHRDSSPRRGGIGERAVAWCCKYLYEVRPRLVVEPDCGCLFLSLQGGRVAVASLTETVRGYVIRSGVGKTGACHIFRHTMATLMLEGGADVRFIQEMVGHANLQTTQIYTRVSIQKLKAIYDATHPGAKLKPAARRATEVRTEAEPTVLLQALAAEADAAPD